MKQIEEKTKVAAAGRLPKEDRIFDGIEAIEEFMGRPSIAFYRWREAFGFPRKRANGRPCLSLAEFSAWAKEWGVENISPKKITEDMLDRRHTLRRLESMPSRRLNSLPEIAKRIGYDTLTISGWHKNGDLTGCPIQCQGKRESSNYFVEERDLLLWMFKENIPLNFGATGVQ